jgi:tetratricopeptide (TPR) repeat protein
LLIGLVDKSLVVAQTGDSRERYRLLETTRAYALEKVNTKEREAVAQRHSEHYCGVAQHADENFGTGSTRAWLATLEEDLENFRVALEWALEGQGAPVVGALIAGNLERMWALAGLSTEARHWIDLGLAKVSEAERPEVAARLWRARARFLQGQSMAECAQKALVLYEQVGDVRGAAHTRRMLAFSLLQTGRLGEAHEAIGSAIEGFKQRGDAAGIASCLSLQGLSAYNEADFAAGRRYYSQALNAYRSLGDEIGMATVLGNFGELEFADGNAERALALVNESLIIRSRGNEKTDLAIDFNNSAAYHVALGQFDEALEAAREALRWALPEQNAWNVATALQHFALLAALRGQREAGARLLGYVDKQLEALGMKREATEQWGYERLLQALKSEEVSGHLERLRADGQAWSEDEAAAEALTI